MQMITQKNGVSASLDSTDLRRVLREYSREMKRTGKSTLAFAVRVYTERMVRLIPLAPKKTVPFDVMTKGKRDPLRVWAKLTSLKIRTRGRGYARQSYRILRAKAIGRQMGGTGYWTGGDVNFRSMVTKHTSGDNPYYELTSKIPYINKLDQKLGLDGKAMHNTVVKLSAMLSRKARSALARA